ncbi:MAG: molybdopterin-dependent oxidoreductase [Chloroflexi bacterium]|nr:molybdopterin-dependent oxidoreductase [Chloroflexota bacterium]
MTDESNQTRGVSRRQFLGWAGASVVAGAVAASGLDLLRPLGTGAATHATRRPSDAPPTQFDREVTSLCEMCVWRCGLRAKVKDERIYKLEGNPFHPHSRGMLCPRGQAGIATAYDPDRLKYPLIRSGPRGSGKWRRLSWNEALDTVAAQMLAIKSQYGAEAMIFSTTHNLVQTQFENMLHAFGTPNYGTQRSLCYNSMITANLMTFGLEEPGRDYSQARYIIYTGRNVLDSISNSEAQDAVSAIARGAKVVVLEPRFTKTAAKATEWLPIKPGTDLAFHLALIQVIIEQELYDADFVQEYTVGFEALRKATRSYTPEWAASKCEIPAETIRRIAVEFAQAAPQAFAHPNWRTSNFLNSFQTERAIACLNALVGSWGRPGSLQPVGGEETAGLGSTPQPAYPRTAAARLDGVPWKYPLVPLKLGVFQELRDNIITGQPYQAHGWFVYRQNPAQSLPDRTKTAEAMSKLDFIVTIDISMNDTAWFSDVVLPEASYLERYDPLAVVDGTVFIRQPAIAPLYESKPGLWIFKELGQRLGLADYFQYQDEEDYIRQQLAPLDITLEELKAKGHYRLPVTEAAGAKAFVFNTPTGKIELSSKTLADSGFSAVPVWEEPVSNEPGTFYLLSGKVAQHTQCATHNNKLLHERVPSNPLWINARPAAERGIKDGDEVWVESLAGKVKTTAYVTEKIRPDCVFMTFGFGHVSKALVSSYGQGASDSSLHLSFTDPVSGSQALSQTFVTITKA